MVFLCTDRPGDAGGDKGLVIFLDGTTSSGKTTLVNGLRKHQQFEHLAEDDEYPLGPNGPSSRDLTKDDLAHKLNHYAKKLARKGKTVVIDEVDIFHCYVNDASRVFAGSSGQFKSILVLMYCPFRDYPLRVGKRNSGGDPNERRSVWRTLIQWAIMFEGNPTEEPGSLEFVSTSAFENTLQLATAMGLGSSRDCIMQREMTKKFITSLMPFDEHSGLWIRPRDDYDLVFCTSGQKDPIQNFKQKVEHFFESGQPSVLEMPRWDRDVDNLNISCGYCSISGVKTAEQVLMSQLLCKDCLSGLAEFTRKKSLARKEQERARRAEQPPAGSGSQHHHHHHHHRHHHHRHEDDGDALSLAPFKHAGKPGLPARPRDKPVQAVASWLFGCLERGRM